MYVRSLANCGFTFIQASLTAKINLVSEERGLAAFLRASASFARQLFIDEKISTIDSSALLGLAGPDVLGFTVAGLTDTDVEQFTLVRGTVRDVLDGGGGATSADAAGAAILAGFSLLIVSSATFSRRAERPSSSDVTPLSPVARLLRNVVVAGIALLVLGSVLLPVSAPFLRGAAGAGIETCLCWLLA